MPPIQSNFCTILCADPRNLGDSYTVERDRRPVIQLEPSLLERENIVV